MLALYLTGDSRSQDDRVGPGGKDENRTACLTSFHGFPILLYRMIAAYIYIDLCQALQSHVFNIQIEVEKIERYDLIVLQLQYL